MDVIVIHGYSSNAKSIRNSLGTTLEKVNNNLGNQGIPGLRLHFADYVSLDDQVQLEDVAEALFLELQSHGFLQGTGRTLRFVVHSTGGLVVRQLLKQYDWMRLRDRVASIAFVAPANFGSPLAAKGKSQLGRLKTIIVDDLFGADKYVSELQFGEVGEQILTDLELAAPRQWALSDFDLFHETDGCLYHSDGIHAAVFVGSHNSDSPARIIADLDGTDGVIVTGGAGLNVRRLCLDVTQPLSSRVGVSTWISGTNNKRLPAIPQVVLPSLDHGTILTDTTVASMILQVLRADSPEAFDMLTAQLDQQANNTLNRNVEQYQQFVLQVTDDRNRPVCDYDLSMNVWSKSTLSTMDVSPIVGQPLALKDTGNVLKAAHVADLSGKLDKGLRDHAYAHSKAREYRRFLIDYNAVQALIDTNEHVLTFSIIAYSGDSRIHYATTHTNHIVVHAPGTTDMPSLFFPNTTTQVRIVLDRYSDDKQIVAVRSPE